MNTKYNRGLSSNEVIISRKKYGSNTLSKKSKNTFIKLIIESFNDPIIKILIIALIFKLLFSFDEYNIYESLGIAIAVFLASFISVLSEMGSERAFERLNNENKLLCVKCIRDNKKIIVNSNDIVVGDIIVLESGDKVPSDSKIINGKVYVDESMLSGETHEKEKKSNDQLFMGSIINNGNAKCEVTLVGDKTYYGKIASLVQENTIDSPLKLRLRKLAGTISKYGYISALIVLLSYLFNALAVSNNFDFSKIFVLSEFIPHLLYGLTLSVAVVVMAVPEGLPMMITLVLSSNMKRMLKKNVLVRKLVGIETAGSLNILFTDKTGTLTEGKLKVEYFIDSNLNSYSSYYKINNIFKELVYISLVYNNESFYNNNTIEGGNTTDKSIINFIGSDLKDKYTINYINHFDSKKKYSSVNISYDNNTFFTKGAYELIIDKCNYYIDNNGKIRVLLNKEKYYEYSLKCTNKGYRLLALAMSKEEMKDMTFIGFILIKDSIRKSSYNGINTIKKAGIHISMVTGDSKETAINVARELNILSSEQDIVLSSDEFNTLSNEKVKEIIPNLKILCRSLPEDKNRLIRLSQELNLITGMTGDGVNDAPALKRADVGFAMGSGTEVAKETSDIVILDNDINSICNAILYGRTIFKSIRKFIIFQLSVNICAVLLSIIAPFIGILTPITVIQVLWINMVMDTLAGLAFAYEPALKEYMDEKPKHKDEPILNKYMINQILLNGVYSFLICIWFLKSNIIKNIYVFEYTDKYLYTAFFGLFIFLSLFNAFNCRTYRINIFSNILKNKIFIFIISFVFIIQIILLYYGGELFRTTGLTIYEFEIMLLISLTIIPFDIIRKIFLKKKGIRRTI